jgi:hypothetical protein
MPKKDAMWVKLSGWLFILGILISVVAGIAPSMIPGITAVLPILGFIIGVLGVAGMGTLEKCDVDVFLLAVIALMAAGGAGNAFTAIDELYGGTILVNVVNNIATLVVPAAVLMALKAIWKSAQTKF